MQQQADKSVRITDRVTLKAAARLGSVAGTSARGVSAPALDYGDA